MKRVPIIAAAALVGALAVAGIARSVLSRELRVSGRARYAHFTGDARVVVVDESRSWRAAAARVRVCDAHTGKELLREPLGRGWGTPDPARDRCYDCIPGAGNRLWCCDMTGDDGLSLRRLDTFALLAGEGQLHALAPGLSQGLLRRIGQHPTPMVDLDDGALLVTGKDGLLYRVGADLTARIEPPRTPDADDEASFRKWADESLHPENLALPAHAVAFQSGEGRLSRARLSERSLRLQGEGVRSVIAIVQPAELPGPPVVRTPHPLESFLDASFVADPDRGQLAPLTFDDPPGLLLAHYELAKAGRLLRLSRVDQSGELVWSAALADGPVLGGRMVDGVAVVVTENALVGLDPATGKLRWQSTF